MGVSRTGLIESFAIHSGITALNIAARRGDVEIVELLLKYGADPYVENDLGFNTFEMCEKAGPFPSVRKMLQRYDKK